MIVLTIAGESSRFFNEGYKEVKYKLRLSNGKSILWNILSYINRNDKIIIVINQKFNDKGWIISLFKSLGFLDFDVIEVAETDGQLTSAVIGIKNSKFFKNREYNEPIFIFNGDTVRHIPFNYEMRNFDGCIEVFYESGDHWSFTDNIGNVSLVKEKERISDFCSTGLYGFSSLDLFLKYSERSKLIKNERYIAPLFNELIKDGLKVCSFLSERECFTLCGTPKEYEDAIGSIK